MKQVPITECQLRDAYVGDVAPMLELAYGTILMRFLQ